jgi:multisubunit Na+/H+ antiporter MnhG subunit
MFIAILASTLPTLGDFFANNIVGWIATLTFLTTLGLFLLEDTYRWTSPTNYLMLGLMTISLGFAIGGITCRFSLYSTVVTLGILVCTIIFILIATLKTAKFEDLMHNLRIACAASSFFLFGIILYILSVFGDKNDNAFRSSIIAGCSSSLFGFYLIADLLWVMDP